MAAALALAPSASAKKPPAPPAPACPAVTSQPFLPDFADPSPYVLVPGGNFERTAWSGGRSATGNEPWFVGSSGDRRSLALAQGRSTTSPEICIGLADPHMRFFVRETTGTLAPWLTVSVNFVDVTGARRTVALPVAAAGATLGGWTVTLPTPVLANVTGAGVRPLDPAATDPRGVVSFTFAAVSGSWLIDDVYLDPYRRN